MMEAREAQAKAIVEGIEQDYAGISERAGRREAALKDEIEEQRQRAEQAEKRIEELEAVMERLDRGEFPMPSFSAEGLQGTPRTPARTPGTPSMMNGTPDFLSQSIMGLSPTVAMASRVQRNGKTFTEVYADYVRLQEDYARKSAEFDNMDRTLSAVLAQIEERVCECVVFPVSIVTYAVCRRPFCPSNAPSMSVCSKSPHNSRRSSHRR